MGLRAMEIPADQASAAAKVAISGGILAGVLGAFGVGSVLALVILLCWKTPRTQKEWAVAIISTFMSSLSLGAFIVLKLGLHRDIMAAAIAGNDIDVWLAVAQAGGVIFGAGLPGWTIVRAAFTWLERREGKDLGELIGDARADMGRAVGGGQP